MRMTASIFYGLHRPSECEVRPYLRQKGVEEGKPSPYEEVIRELGRRYERQHLSTIEKYVDVSNGTEDERINLTMQAVKDGAPALYHPLFRITTKLGKGDAVILGEPDLMIKDGDGYRIRDVKMARRITETDHPEILLQLGMYGWLYEQTFKAKATALEVLAGTGNLEKISPASVEAALKALERIAQIIGGDAEPFAPVGWTKCGSCGFYDRCWTNALKTKDVATVPAVDQNLTRALREKGIKSIDELLQAFDASTLANFEKPWGTKRQKVGKAAERILRAAKVISTGKEELLQTPAIPAAESYVMFDVEGLPPQLDELDKVYLWGLQVFGAKSGEYLGKIAGIGTEGDRAGWMGFLEAAKGVFDRCGDIPFVHWTHYEKTKLSLYVNRFGDKEGVAERVKKNMVDLFVITQNAVVLPLPSYSLKVVEEYVGFKRSQDEYGGNWAMAAFIQATETSEEAKRKELFDSIITYNREDLAATWAVLQWLATKKAN
jgi:predicted RecB family nuclease